MGRRIPPDQNSVLRQFATELVRLRTMAEMSQRDVAKATGFSQQQVGAIERVKRYPDRRFAEMADELLSGDGILVRLWPKLHIDPYPEYLGGLVEAEQSAAMIREYHPTLVPGLLQTPGYARTTLAAADSLASHDGIDRMVDARMKRQWLLERPNRPALWVIIDEAVVLRPVGSDKIMSDQIGRLLDLHEGRRIQLQVTPFTARHPPGLTGPFTILSFADKPDVVYVETVAKGEMVNDPDQVDPVSLLFTTLQGAALSPERSVDRLNEIRKEFDETQLA